MNDSVFTMETVPLKMGWGVVREVGADMAALGMSRVLLFTDPHIRGLGLTATVEEAAASAGIDLDVYDGVVCEPTDEAWREAIAVAEDGDYDGYIAVGGGSTIDTAKAANLYSTYPNDFLAYINKPIGRAEAIPGPLKPLIAIPTTAGTGSETTSVAVLDILDLEVKTGISHRRLRPCLAIVDPELTLSAPPAVTAAVGLDVLCHALESYLARPYDEREQPAHPSQRPPYVGANPISDVWSTHAIRLVHRYLRRAVADPNDREARFNMAQASTFAGMGFGNAGCQIPHAMAYPIAGMVKQFVPNGYPDAKVMVPHGVAVALGAPAAFRFLAGAHVDKQLIALSCLGCDDVAPQDTAETLAGAIVDLMRDLNQPNGLTAVGYDEGDIPALVAGTLKQQRLLKLAPVTVGESKLTNIFKNAMKLWAD